jgi:hypothetical protein
MALFTQQTMKHPCSAFLAFFIAEGGLERTYDSESCSINPVAKEGGTHTLFFDRDKIEQDYGKVAGGSNPLT